MTLFWVLCALLAAGVLALVLRPLVRGGAAAQVSRREANIAVYRDQRRELDADLAAGKLAPDEHEKARAELEARLLEDVDAAAESAPAPRGSRRAAVALGVTVPVAALAIYLAVGLPAAVDAPPGHGGDITAHQIEVMVERLAARLRENPDDADGWKMLGRSYAVLGRFGEAVDAYAKAALRAPRDAQLLADFADALAMARGRSLQGEPEKLVQRALEIEPTNLKALALAGTAAFEREAFKTAADYWGRMLPLVPPDSADAQAIRDNVAQATQLAGGKPPGPQAAAPPAAALRGSVRIAPALKGKYGAEDTVFIYARAAEGPPLPLAILRRKAGELPLDFALDDSMAMAPGAELSSFPRIVVTARISRSGQAKAQPGDLQGASAPVASDARGVEVVIDTEVR